MPSGQFPLKKGVCKHWTGWLDWFTWTHRLSGLESWPRPYVKPINSNLTLPTPPNAIYTKHHLPSWWVSYHCEGLIDVESEEVLYHKLQEKRVEWKRKEENNPTCCAGLLEWFCNNKLDAITTGMLKPIREDTGLGVPPAIFTTNASESINFVLNRKVNHNKNELPSFVTHLKEIIDE